MRAEVVAVGTELLLGQVVDTNSAWIGEQLAAAGIDCHYQTKVGDNLDRIAAALRCALARNEAVVVCGGLGPTQDDITREAIAQVMGVRLVRRPELLGAIEKMFGARGRPMPESNARQADVPEGATPIPQATGTAPGLICPLGHKVIYAVPGVPDEMREMVSRAVIPDLRRRAGGPAVIHSRVLRTWGLAESSLAEVLAPRLEALERSGQVTMAFLASGIEGIKVRLTAKAPDLESARALLEAEEAQVRRLLGHHVFGVDDETMEHAVGSALAARGLTLGLAESVTGGLVASRLVAVPGASAWFRGSVVAYDPAVKARVLGVPPGPLVSEATARAMAEGARRVLGSDVGLGVTGAAGPEGHDGAQVGTVWYALAGPGRVSEAAELRLPAGRERVRQLATIAVL
ncbi:MAG TPA: competence/damage-inducible protein A, partial [Acidimicrobiales bacterium]|nr:competence/damage-inducible protein A [Acidimicrobiales bacterium]